MRIAAWIAVLLVAGSSVVRGEDFPRPRLPDLSKHGRNLQRTMRLLDESTAEHPNTVRILFYGQSITEQAWTKAVAADLKSRFPHANLIIENRALGGFASQMLVKCVETDVVAFQPDLLIFHVYGAHDKYEEILRTVRERTTAEILQQNDHLRSTDKLDQNTDPATNQNPMNWDGFMNYHWLPSMSAKYQTEFCDQRAIWIEYLKDNKLEPQAVLSDAVHLNRRGEFLMAEIVKAHLRRDRALDPSPAENWVTTRRVGTDVQWSGDTLNVDFEGAGIVAQLDASKSAVLRFTIDGRKPSEFSQLSAHGRSHATPGGKWPPIAPIGSEQPLVLETWTLYARRDDASENRFTFNVEGSVTGPDGEGASDQRFVSKSGRVVIEPGAWNIKFTMMLAQVKPEPAEFRVTWNVEPRFVDEWPRKVASGTPRSVWIANGLPPGKHRLSVEGAEHAGLQAVEIHAPPLNRPPVEDVPRAE